MSDNKSNRTTARICVSFSKRGKCAWGEMCKSQHVKDSAANGKQPSRKEPRSQTSSTSSKSKKVPKAKTEPPTEEETQAPAAILASRSPTPRDLSREKSAEIEDEGDICHFYPNCGNGNECDFKHVDPPSVLPKTTSDGRPLYSKRLSATPSELSTSSKRSICKYFAKGYCTRGSQCHHDHPAKDETPSSTSIQEHDSEYRAASPFGYAHIDDEEDNDEAKDDDGPEDSEDSEPHHSRDDHPYPMAKVQEATPNRSTRDESDASTAAEVPEDSAFKLYADSQHPPPQLVATVMPAQHNIPVLHVAQMTLHWSQFADTNANGEVAFCKQFAQNNCLLQQQCRFRHSLTVQEYTLLFKDQQPTLMTIGQVANPPAPPVQPYSSLVPVQPQPVQPTTTSYPIAPASIPPAAAPSQKKCVFYPLGRCKNGMKCPFLHEDPPSTPGSSDWNALDNLRSRSPVQPVCRFFQKSGYCRAGDNCDYRHITSSEVQRYASQAAASARADTQWDPEDNGNEWGATTNVDSDWGQPSDQAATTDNWNGGDENNTQNRRKANDTWSSGETGSKSSGSRSMCYDYQKGQCTRGIRCKYSHGESQTRPCKYYQSGSCSKGDNCQYKHEERPEQKNRQAESQAGEPWVSGWGESAVTFEWGGDTTEQTDTAWEQTEDLGIDQQEETLHDNENLGDEYSGGTDNDDTVDVVDAGNDDTVDVGNDDDRENIGEGWTQSNSWQEVGDDSGNEPIKQSLACLAFGQGACAKGDACTFSHILPPDQVEFHFSLGAATPEAHEPEYEPSVNHEEEENVGDNDGSRSPTPEVVEVHPLVERFFHNCTVRFDSQCRPEDIMTAAHSRKMVLSNLPSDTNPEEIRGLVQQFGEVQDVVELQMGQDTATMSVGFSHQDEALAAVRQLNGQTFSERPIAARLDSRTVVCARSPLHSHVLLVSWPSATMTAWTYYGTMSLSKQAAQKLDNMKFKGHTLKAICDKNANKKSPYPVRITNLPVAISKEEVETLCKEDKPMVITLGNPTYAKSPRDDIREVLETFGRVESFDVSEEENDMSKTMAYVMMETYSAAQNAAVALNGSKPDYLGGEQALKVQHIYLARYKMPVKAFECTRNQLDILRQTYKGKCTILDYPQFEFHVIQIHAPVDSTTFSSANDDIEALVNGHVLVSEEQGVNLWDEYFDSSSGMKIIDKRNKRATDIPSFICPDRRLRLIRIYGSLDGQKREKDAIQKILKRVAEQRHEIAVPRLKMAPFIATGLAALQAPGSIGPNKVRLDVVSSKLVIRGTEDDVGRANLALNVLASSQAESTVARSKLCPICERVPVDPVVLTCRHAYCRACLQFGLTGSAKDEAAFFSCIFSNPEASSSVTCGVGISYAIVRDMLQMTTEVDFLKASFTSFIRANREQYFFCPTADCDALYRSGEEGIVIRCTMCLGDLCPRCCSRSHDGRLCSERPSVGYNQV